MSGYRQPAYASSLRKLVEGTEVLRTGGGATLTASECNALVEKLEELEDRNRWRWPAERARADLLRDALQRLKSNVWRWEVPDDVKEQVDAALAEDVPK